MIRRFPRKDSRRTPVVATYATSMWKGFRERGLFRDVRTYCMFIGYPRSGHSLVGSLLDAHPDVVVSHELDALGFLQHGFHRNQIFALILNNARAVGAAGREQTGYPYQVPGGWQGRFERLLVIGDKRGMTSMYRIQRRPELLARLRREVQVPVRYVHVVRNPFDNISTMAKRRDLSLELSAETYFTLCRTVAHVKRSEASDSVMDVRHEMLISDPKGSLGALCRFLGVTASDDYLDRCAAIVFPSPRQTRHEAAWTDQLIQGVQSRMGEFPFLEGYSWEA
jgi:hypothetical protein